MSSQNGPYRSGKTRFEIFIFRHTYAKYVEYVEYAEYVHEKYVIYAKYAKYVILVYYLGCGGMRFPAV
jgi:hypothetical protein